MLGPAPPEARAEPAWCEGIIPGLAPPEATTGPLGRRAAPLPGTVAPPDPAARAADG